MGIMWLDDADADDGDYRMFSKVLISFFYWQQWYCDVDNNVMTSEILWWNDF
jgi:hypothetical protein